MNQNAQLSETPARHLNRTGLNRLQGISVIASVALPIMAAYIVYYTGVGMPTATTNQGELLQPPIDVKQLPFVERGSGPLEFTAEAPKWRYLVIPAGDCDAECEKLLYTSRQVHIRLAEKADRIERLMVSTVPLSDARYRQLQHDHPRLRFVTLAPAALIKLERDAGFAKWDRPRALLVDQQGFAMMAYDNRNTGNQLLKDIKRLLKYSYEK